MNKMPIYFVKFLLFTYVIINFKDKFTYLHTIG